MTYVYLKSLNLTLCKRLCKSIGVKCKETTNVKNRAHEELPNANPGTPSVNPDSAAKHSAQFMAARDSRNRRISGLSIRNGRFYGVLWADRGDGRKTARRFPLLDESGEPIRTLSAAKDALEALKSHRHENKLPTGGQKPSFDVFSNEYLNMASTRAKRGATQKREPLGTENLRIRLYKPRTESKSSDATLQSQSACRIF